jgi:cell wall-associated NlpC family hydrolase
MPRKKIRSSKYTWMTTEPHHSPWTPERLAAAWSEYERWRGTPHRHRIAIPGQGIDCIHLTFKILQAAGILPFCKLPSYDEQWGVGNKNNIAQEVMEDIAHCRPTDQAANGNILIWKVGRQSNHMGILLQEKAVHAQAGSFVDAVPFSEIAPRLQSMLRFTKAGFKHRPELLNFRKYLTKANG